MNIDILLKERKVLLIKCPNVPFEVGDVIEDIRHGYIYNNGVNLCIKANDYPGIFGNLEWWEKRKESEMPKFLKTIKPDYYYSVQEVDKWSIGCTNVITKQWGSFQSTNVLGLCVCAGIVVQMFSLST